MDVARNRTAVLAYVGVIRTPPDAPLEQRLLTIGTALAALLDEYRPDAFAIERVFAQQNLRTVMGVAQISGIAIHHAAARGVPVALHTPSEVKAAITGYGSADKSQVTAMVTRILGLAEAPKPADAADALAIAVCHAWRGGPVIAAAGGAQTPAQQAWAAAERASRRP